jgi:hypothetical protein
VGSTTPSVRPGAPELAAAVLAALVAPDGLLDRTLQQVKEDHPTSMRYARWELDELDSQLLNEVGVVWLPQVRLIRGEQTLIRSAVSMADNGKFVAADVGGQSYRRSEAPLILLSDLICREAERSIQKKPIRR